MKQRTSKDAPEFILCWTWGLPLKVIISLVESHKEGSFLICRWLSTGDGIWARDGDMCPLSSALGLHLKQTSVGTVYTAIVSRDSWCSQRLCATVLLINPFCLIFHGVLWALRGGFDGDIPLRTECSKASDSLHVSQMWVSVFVSSASGGSFSDDGWARHCSMSIAGCR